MEAQQHSEISLFNHPALQQASLMSMLVHLGSTAAAGSSSTNQAAGLAAGSSGNSSMAEASLSFAPFPVYEQKPVRPPGYAYYLMLFLEHHAEHRM